MVEEFDAWCFDPDREPGDTDIVETTYGYHIMYYVGDDHPHWKTGAEAALRTGDRSFPVASRVHSVSRMTRRTDRNASRMTRRTDRRQRARRRAC